MALTEAEAVTTVRAGLSGLSEREQAWADDKCILRHLRARRMNTDKTIAQMKETLKWRKDIDIYKLHAGMFSKDLAEGKLYVAGTTASGHAVLMMRKREYAIPVKDGPAYIRFLAWTLENTACCTEHGGQEKWNVIMDMNGYTPQNSPAMSITREVLGIVSHHYPERLDKVYLVDAPTIFWVLWNTVRPFVDPVTRAKVNIVYTKYYDPATGRLLSGEDDPTCFDKVSTHHAQAYNEASYLKLVKEVRGVSAVYTSGGRLGHANHIDTLTKVGASSVNGVDTVDGGNVPESVAVPTS